MPRIHNVGVIMIIHASSDVWNQVDDEDRELLGWVMVCLGYFYPVGQRIYTSTWKSHANLEIALGIRVSHDSAVMFAHKFDLMRDIVKHPMTDDNLVIFSSDFSTIHYNGPRRYMSHPNFHRHFQID